MRYQSQIVHDCRSIIFILVDWYVLGSHPMVLWGDSPSSGQERVTPCSGIHIMHAMNSRAYLQNLHSSSLSCVFSPI